MTCRLRTICCAAMALSLAACTARVAPTDAAPEVATVSIDACRDLYRNVDARVEDAGVGDAQSARIAGYPYLRIDRFLAADEIKPGVNSEDFEAWVERLRDLDVEASLAGVPEGWKQPVDAKASQ